MPTSNTVLFISKFTLLLVQVLGLLLCPSLVQFKRLMKLKEPKNESKLKNVKYEKLEGQQYLTTLDVRKAKTVFRFRTEMAQFSGNYKGQNFAHSVVVAVTTRK